MHDESFCHKRKTFVPRKKKKKEKGEKKAKNFFIKNFHSENREDYFFSSLSLFVVQTEGFKVSIAFGNSADIMNRPR